MKFKFVIFLAHYCLFFGLLSCNLQRTPKDTENLWLNNLINYILQNTSSYQTVIITDNRQNAGTVLTKIDNIVAKISREMPVMLLDMDHLLQFQKPDNLSCDTSHFDTSNLFFIYINTFGYTLPEHSQKTTDMLRWLSCNSLESKILVIQFRETNPDLEQQLRYVWQRKMLDFTILEVIVRRGRQSFFLSENFVQSLYFVHRLNPFTEVYTNEEYKSETEFFPKKLKDMNGYKLKTSMIHLPPRSDLKKNASGLVIDVAGMDGMTLKALEKTLNFKAEMITDKSDTFGKILPNGSETHIFKELQDGAIEFICSGIYVFGSPLHKRVERTTTIRVEKCCALVPIIPTDKLLLTKSSYVAMMVTGVIVLVVWITTLLMKFDSEIMDPLILICMLMAVPISREPSNSVERIIFGSCLIVSLTYSSTVFAELIGILIKTKGQVPFESLDDLDKSGLHLLMHPTLINRTFANAEHDQVLLNLRKKTEEYFFINKCPNILLKNRNISCTGAESWIKMVIQITRKQDEYTMKLAKPCFWSSPMAFILQKGSPYVHSFNKVISKVTECGLDLKWYDDYMRQVMFEAKRKEGYYNKQEEKDGLVQQLKTVIYYGSLISFIFLVGEFILFKIQKKINRMVTRLKIQ